LKATNFDFSIPTGSTIDGIEARVEHSYYYSMMPPEKYCKVDHIQIKVYYTEPTNTGWVSPETVGESGTGESWTNKDNVKTDDTSYTRGLVGDDLEGNPDIYINSVKIIKGGSITGDEMSEAEMLASTATTDTFGGVASLWGTTLTSSDVNSSNFGFAIKYNGDGMDQNFTTKYLTLTNLGFNIPAGSTIEGIEAKIRHLYGYEGGDLVYARGEYTQIKVYYTESSTTPTVGTKYALPAFKRP